MTAVGRRLAMTMEFAGDFQPAFTSTVRKPAYLQDLQHLQTNVYQRARVYARVCAQECKSLESAVSAESRKPIPTALPPVKGTTKQQGRKGNSNRVFSVAANFSTYLTQHLTGQHQHDTA